MKSRNTLIFISILIPWVSRAAEVTITASNNLSLARTSQTIEVTAAQLAPLAAENLALVHVKDATGKELVVQAVDTDGDAYRKADFLIFQADFAANESQTFTAFPGKKQIYKKDQYKAYGRFARERFDDFAWENDRIAHRTYGKALETWEGDPLASSTIDIWSKRTPRLVINDWYLTDDYHEDSGDGADFYSAGTSRGCGGDGLWASDRLWTSRGFTRSNVLANGPIRVMFELTYEPFELNGISVSEVKRVTLDAGSQLDHFQSIYKPFTRPGQLQKLTAAIGLKKTTGEQKEVNASQGWMIKWEKVAKGGGHQGLAIAIDPKQWIRETEDSLNLLVLANTGESNSISYHAGFCWDKAGDITTAEAWKQYIGDFAQGLASPIATRVTTVEN